MLVLIEAMEAFIDVRPGVVPPATRVSSIESRSVVAVLTCVTGAYVFKVALHRGQQVGQLFVELDCDIQGIHAPADLG